MNYHYADWIYKKYKLEDKFTYDYFQMAGRELSNVCKKSGIACNFTF